MKVPRRTQGSTPRPTRFAGPAFLIFTAALAVRLAHLWQMRGSPFTGVLLGDARSYDTWAWQIASGDWIGTDVFYQAPLYAYFLAAIYSIDRSLVVVRVCQAAIGASSCVLVGYAARQFFGNTVGLVAGLMLAFYAPAVFFDGLVQKSVLDVFFLCLVLALSSGLLTDPARPCRWLGVGLALGGLSLTRENALLFVPVVLGWIWAHGRAPRRGSRAGDPAGRPRGTAWLQWAMMLLVGTAMLLLPVGLRNRLVGGEFHLTTAQAGPNFYIGNNPQADGTYMSLRFGRGSPEYERSDATEIAEQASGRTLSPGEVSRYWTGRALEYIGARPLDWLALEGRKFWLLWNASEVMDTESQESYADYSLPLRVIGRVAHFGVLAPLAFAGIWITRSEWRRLWLLHALLGTYACSVLAFYVVARYRLPLAPFLIIFAAAAVVHAGRSLATPSRKPLGTRGVAKASALPAIVGLLAIWCNWPAVSADLMCAVTYHNLGAALQADGRLEEAVAAYQQALKIRPEYAPSHNNLGSVLRQQGKLDAAIGHLEQAVRLHADFADARYNLANALAARGRLSEAIARYEELLQRRSDAVDVLSNLGIALATAGRLEAAIEYFRRAVTLAPQTADAHYNLGAALIARAQFDEAIEHLSQAVRIDPAHASAHYELANGYLARQRLDEAVDHYRAALRLSPKLVEAHNNLGIALWSLGRLNDAIEAFRSVLQIDPTFAEAQANLQAVVAALAARHRSSRTPRGGGARPGDRR